MLIVPLQPVPSQIVNVNLAGQATTLSVYQRRPGLFTDISTTQLGLVQAGVLCENFNRLIRSLYLGYFGDFVYIDLAGNSDPYYAGLGSRWQLVWMEPGVDYPLGVG